MEGHMQDTHDPEARAQLVKAVRLASRQLDAAYDKASTARDYNAAFGVALRSEELLLWAENLQLEGFSSSSAQTQLEQARQKAIRQTLQKVDQGESEGAPHPYRSERSELPFPRSAVGQQQMRA